MKIFKDKRTRVLIIIMSALVLVAIAIASFWFRRENAAEDPRVVEANNMYAKYNSMAREARFDEILALLDSIEAIYQEIPHYRNSFEVGVLYNNRAAVYITRAISPEITDSITRDSLLSVAEVYARKSIEIYTHWLNDWREFDEKQIITNLKPHFGSDEPALAKGNIERYVQKRAKVINEARVETPRRLSASHTNLGIIFRHQQKYDEAVQEYLKALELWGDNLAAENNMNILLNKPLKKRSMFRKIFPKDRFQE